jgi:hypothetical protein
MGRDERWRRQDGLEDDGASFTGDSYPLGVEQGLAPPAGRALVRDQVRQDIEAAVQVPAVPPVVDQPLPPFDAQSRVVRPAKHLGEAMAGPVVGRQCLTHGRFKRQGTLDQLRWDLSGQALFVSGDASKRGRDMDLIAELLGQSELEIAVPQPLSIVLPQQVQTTRQLGLAAHPEPIVVARLLDGLPEERDAGPAVGTNQVIERQLGEGQAADLGRRIGFEQLLGDSPGSMEIAGGGRVAGLRQPSSGHVGGTSGGVRWIEGSQQAAASGAPRARALLAAASRLWRPPRRVPRSQAPDDDSSSIGHDLGQTSMYLATSFRAIRAARRTEWVDDRSDPRARRPVHRSPGPARYQSDD